MGQTANPYFSGGAKMGSGRSMFAPLLEAEFRTSNGLTPLDRGAYKVRRFFAANFFADAALAELVFSGKNIGG